MCQIFHTGALSFVYSDMPEQPWNGYFNVLILRKQHGVVCWKNLYSTRVDTELWYRNAYVNNEFKAFLNFFICFSLIKWHLKMGNVNVQKNIERKFSGFPHRKRVNSVNTGVKCRPLCQQLKWMKMKMLVCVLNVFLQQTQNAESTSSVLFVSQLEQPRIIFSVLIWGQKCTFMIHVCVSGAAQMWQCPDSLLLTHEGRCNKIFWVVLYLTLLHYITM